MSTVDWIPGSYLIAQPDDRTIRVDGFISGPFGVHRQNFSERPWSITHLKTGWSVGFMPTRKAAIAYAAEILGLTDWESITTDDRGKITRLCAPAWERHTGLQAPAPAAAREGAGR